MPYPTIGMKKEQLARKLARDSHISLGAAADQLDRIVHDILKRVRSGQTARLPGFGTFHPDRCQGIEFEAARKPRSKQDVSKKASK